MTHVCVVGWVGEWWTLFRNGLRLLLNGLLLACHVSVGPIDGAALRSFNTCFSHDEKPCRSHHGRFCDQLMLQKDVISDAYRR